MSAHPQYDTVAAAFVLARQRDRLLTALEAMIPIFEAWLKEAGGCDHSVGICMCSELCILDEAKSAVAEVDG